MSGAKNNGAAAHLVEMIRNVVPTGGILLILFDEEAVPSSPELGVITVDGSFRLGPVLTDRGAHTIRELGKRIGEHARAEIKRVTEGIGGEVLSDESTLEGPRIGPSSKDPKS